VEEIRARVSYCCLARFVVYGRSGELIKAGRLRIAFVVGGFYTEASGIARAVASLSENLIALGHEVSLFVPSYLRKPVATHLLAPQVKLYSAPGCWFFRLGLAPKLKEVMRQQLPGHDVVHTHSLWMLPTHYATQIASSHNIPIVASIQGFLDPWALNHHVWKKRMISRLFQKRDMQNASVIHALTEQEITYIRSYCNPHSVAVIPNGVPDQVLQNTGSRDRFFEAYPDLRQYRLMVFISRLHYKKGLDILIDAWREVTSGVPQWKLVIAGPDDGYERALRQAIETNGCKDSVIMLPAQYDQAKYDLLAAAECFVLPSRSEGLPMALLEAMAVGKPVVYTTGCYLPEAAEHGAGYEVDCSTASLAQALRQIMHSEPRRLIEMGQRGQALVREKYLWSRIAGQFEEVYRWLVSGKPAPVPSTIRMFPPN